MYEPLCWVSERHRRYDFRQAFVMPPTNRPACELFMLSDESGLWLEPILSRNFGVNLWTFCKFDHFILCTIIEWYSFQKEGKLTLKKFYKIGVRRQSHNFFDKYTNTRSSNKKKRIFVRCFIFGETAIFTIDWQVQTWSLKVFCLRKINNWYHKRGQMKS